MPWILSAVSTHKITCGGRFTQKILCVQTASGLSFWIANVRFKCRYESLFHFVWPVEMCLLMTSENVTVIMQMGARSSRRISKGVCNFLGLALDIVEFEFYSFCRGYHFSSAPIDATINLWASLAPHSSLYSKRGTFLRWFWFLRQMRIVLLIRFVYRTSAFPQTYFCFNIHIQQLMNTCTIIIYNILLFVR